MNRHSEGGLPMKLPFWAAAWWTACYMQALMEDQGVAPIVAPAVQALFAASAKAQAATPL